MQKESFPEQWKDDKIGEGDNIGVSGGYGNILAHEGYLGKYFHVRPNAPEQNLLMKAKYVKEQGSNT